MTMTRKTIGSIAWPYLEKPGFALILQVEYDRTKEHEPYRFKTVAEAQSPSILGIVHEALRLHDIYEAEEWYGDVLNEPIMSMVYAGVQDAGRLPLIPTPYLDDKEHTRLSLQTILDCLTRNPEGHVLLSLHPGSRIAGHLMSLNKQNPVKLQELPPLAALGYGINALYLWLQLEFEKPRKSLVQSIIDQSEKKTRDYDEYKQYWTDEEMLEELEWR